MHGRVKVKTPAEQAEARKAERLKKIQWYTESVQTIFKKRDDEELDKELLAKSEELLRVNPDFMTVWNIRRRTLLRLVETDRSSAAALPDGPTCGDDDNGSATSPEGEKNEVKEESTEQKAVEKEAAPSRDERLLPELKLTVACLSINPKSYGAWHHRSWVMDQFDKPNWNREVDLCSHALSKDSRNFHCWDYRRFVAKRSTRSDADEVAFTSDKIKASYSNYSAWHNRGRLLPAIHPGPAGCGLSTEKLQQELDFARNAMYTDPVDQSAFFYHRWLLGREDVRLAIRCMYADRERQQITVVLNKPFDLLNGSACVVVDGEYEIASWQTNDPRSPASTVLLCQLSEGQLSASNPHTLTLEVTYKDETAIQVLELDQDLPTACFYCVPERYTMFRSLAAAPDVLQAELESLLALLEINDEEDSKWALLTTVLLLQTLDPVGHRHQVQKHFDSLLRIDAMRRGYYNDLRSRYLVQSIAQGMWRSVDPGQLWQGSRSLDLTSKSLHGLFHLDCWPWLLRLDISNNKLTSLSGCQLLPYLEELVANDNIIEEIGDEVTCLKSLTRLSLANNSIHSFGSSLKHLHCLRLLVVAGNPVAKETEMCTEAMVTMTMRDREVPFELLS